MLTPKLAREMLARPPVDLFGGGTPMSKEEREVVNKEWAKSGLLSVKELLEEKANEKN